MKSLLLCDFPLRDLEIQGGASLATRTGIGTPAPELRAEASMSLKQAGSSSSSLEGHVILRVPLPVSAHERLHLWLPVSPCGKVTQSQF